jgi:hypothetical protein
MVEQGGLANARIATDDQHLAPATADGRHQPVQGSTFVGPSDQVVIRSWSCAVTIGHGIRASCSRSQQNNAAVVHWRYPTKCASGGLRISANGASLDLHITHDILSSTLEAT